MRKRSFLISSKILLCLFSLFLITAGISRYLETDSGNILIHDIDLENFEGFIYKGRLYRPIQASSMNQRPGILLVFGKISDRYTGDHIAMEFARRGFVVLSIEDFSQGLTDPKPEFETENLVDAGYTFLSTRTFTDHSRLGIVAYYSGTEKAVNAKYIKDFSSGIFVCPPAWIQEEEMPVDQVFTAKYETDPDFRPTGSIQQKNKMFSASHSGMINSAAAIAALTEHFHETLAIPNDSPFWFDPFSQRAQLLTGLRFFLLCLTLIICNGISTKITSRKMNKYLQAFGGTVIPLLYLTAIEEFMNFFLVSVRIGCVFFYLPRIRQVLRSFSSVALTVFVLVSFFSSLSFGKNKKWLLSDVFSLSGILICMSGFIPILFSEKSGWELSGTAKFRFVILIITILSISNSFLLRLSGSNKFAKRCSAVLNGIIFYWICGNPLQNLIIGS